MADIHIGAFRQPELRKLLTSTFEAAVQECIDAGVDFVVMSGDIFDSNIPDLSSVREATSCIRRAKDRGIRFYVVYGSHDYSPNHASVVDVLESAGLFTKVDRGSTKDGKLELEFVVDETGAKICGVSGKKLSLDRSEYESLNRKRLESEPGFKIFVFHGAVEELRPESLHNMEAMPASLLPSDFCYYAGGHVHNRNSVSLPARPNIAYPGTLFATDFRDLEPLAQGEQHGFYIVEFEDRVEDIRFVPLSVCEVVGLEYSVNGKSAELARGELMTLARTSDVKGKVVLLRVRGELSEGLTADIGISLIRKVLASKGPLCVLPNLTQLTSKELTTQSAVPKTPDQTERDCFAHGILSVKVPDPRLSGENGVKLSLELLRSLKDERKDNETKADYQERVERAGLDVLGLEGESPC